ncbi:LysR family transcriptional regulator [Microbacterium sp.]|uniref:LysR family transcriptional regulator n=1 Tax=Microbacterium sp. TaxID=51671 RepID=UPI002D79FCEE|nr:LysR substrate-binding domain-containing protein [Microbacterium sp.]HET6302699.1 LysR substrate-binding domain-containing protein [Microbacterium sp.]
MVAEVDPAAGDVPSPLADRHDFTLRQLEHFVAVAEHGSIATAAERLFMSPTAVSLSIRQLERTLDTELLVRKRAQGAQLTPMGRALLPHAKDVLASATRLTQEIATDDVLRGAVDVGCFPSLGPSMLPGFVRAFSSRHPAVKVRFREDALVRLVPELLAGALDLMLAYDIGLGDEVDRMVVASRRLGVMLPKDHWAADESRPIDFARLVREPFIELASPAAHRDAERVFAIGGATPDERIPSENFETVRSFVGRGLGWSITLQRPRNLTHEGLEVVVRDVPGVDPVDIVLAWRRGAALSRQARAFRDVVRDAAG